MSQFRTIKWSKDLEIDKYYRAISNNRNDYIFLVNHLNSNGNNKAINQPLSDNPEFCESHGLISETHCQWDLRPATWNEIAWLDACIKANKFISLDQVIPKQLPIFN